MRNFQKFSIALFCFSVLCPAVHAQDALWRTYFGSAEKAFRKSDLPAAEALLNSANSAARRPDDSITTMYYLGRVHERMGDSDKAERDYKSVLEYLGPKVWAVLRPPDGTPAWDAVDSFASDQTLSTKQFLAISKKKQHALQSDLAKPITTVDVLTDLGVLMQQQKRNLEAEQFYRQALMLSELRTESIPFTQPRILQRLASLYKAEDKQPEAAALIKQIDDLRNSSMPEFEQVVQKSLLEINKGKHRNQDAVRLNNLALFCAIHGDYGRADELYSRSLAHMNQSGKSKSPDERIILRNYSDLLQAMGRNDDARKYLQQAEKLGGVQSDQQSSLSSTSSAKNQSIDSASP